MDFENIIKIAVDAYHGRTQKYSTEQSMELLRKALVEMNGGSTKLDLRRIRDGECKGLFTLVEEILTRTVVEGLTENDFFNSMVDFRNVANGDQNVFLIEDNNLFVVSKVADGTVGVRRQRLSGTEEASVPTERRYVKIYEELDRVLSGRVDFNAMIAKVAESFKQQLLQDIYTAWADAASEDMGGETYFPAAGTYDEDELLDLIAHVEAAAGGKPATIVCTKKAARILAPSIQGTDSKSDLYNMGYYGKFYGAPVVVVPNRHKANSTEFVMSDDYFTIIAGDDKPIKVKTLRSALASVA